MQTAAGSMGAQGSNSLKEGSSARTIKEIHDGLYPKAARGKDKNSNADKTAEQTHRHPRHPSLGSPAKGRPAILMDSSMGTERRRCSQLAALSPVQMGPVRWLPAKKDRLSTNGRSPSDPKMDLPLSTRPWAVAM